MNAWATDMQRQANNEPRRLECANVDDSEAAYLTEHAIGLLGMYATYADPGSVDGISSTVSRQILLHPRLQGLSTEEIDNKLAIKDAFLMEGIGAHALSLDILGLLVDVEAKTGAAKRADSSNPPGLGGPSLTRNAPAVAASIDGSPSAEPKAESAHAASVASSAMCNNGHPMDPKIARCVDCGARLKMQWMHRGQ